MIDTIFSIFAILSLILFRFMKPIQAVTVICLVGWLILPVGDLGDDLKSGFSFWIPGLALPSYLSNTKIWVPPVTALVGAMIVDHQRILAWRPRWIDIPMALWCVWPLVQGFLVTDPNPPAWVSALYVTGAWGVPWLLGRIYYADREGGDYLIKGIAIQILVLAPIGLLEGLFGPFLYDFIYQPHPFRTDGAERYFGYRPLGFFENGNQYGIWVATLALAAFWLWQAAPDRRMRSFRLAIAGLAIAVAVASQSVGAIILMFIGLAILIAPGRRYLRAALPVALFASIAACSFYSSGGLLKLLNAKSGIGSDIRGKIEASGRNSLIWRMERGAEARSVVAERPWVGSGRWGDWKTFMRPWDLLLLMAGQFGGIGVILCFGLLLLVSLKVLLAKKHFRVGSSRSVALPLAVIVLAALGDMFFNSFICFPALLAAGAIGIPTPPLAPSKAARLRRMRGAAK